ncbi:hypothetical protein PV08_03269 [Exophiala spinifera]|uniref:Uncharacterized protein n=1 Tax=Exophiala spinifera TaxID=91928 RepID=A0A0D2BK93_9EURO|nr:uncharacterized protein PV08_03269 [Exophiala spinifera]KIW18980.1 hypothetical protein PV08_03269 [Exophiala spinifera]
MSSLGYQYEAIVRSTGIPRRSVVNIIKKARERGFNPQQDPRVLDHFIIDGYKPGRPKGTKETAEREGPADIPQDRASREESSG